MARCRLSASRRRQTQAWDVSVPARQQVDAQTKSTVTARCQKPVQRRPAISTRIDRSFGRIVGGKLRSISDAASPPQSPWTSIAGLGTGHSCPLTVISYSTLRCPPSSVQGSFASLAAVCCRRGRPVGLRKILSKRRGEMADKLRQYSSAGSCSQSSEQMRDELSSIYFWSLISLAC